MTNRFWRVAAFGLAVASGALLAGCEDPLEGGPNRAYRPISSGTLAEMSKIDTTPASPVLIRTYKKEAELEIWKMKTDGRYALLKTYPMCRWSGQLGPKTREGDRQVPEGFYPITPAQMNPNSNYYLSFNVGYPNAYDRAYGRTGGTIMVHGACSSAGCFSMTDAEIADIYAIAREAFAGGQREIQMQSLPFHMTAENLVKHRLDPNIDFWKQLKNGADHFEVTKTEPSVLVCGKRYVFGAQASGEVSASAACPPLQRDPDVESLVAAKDSQDEAKVAELAASGVKPVQLVYFDGGSNPAFAGRNDVSRPEALVSPPQEVALDEARPAVVPAAVKVASADAKKREAAAGPLAPAAPAPIPAIAVALAPLPAAAPAAQQPAPAGAAESGVASPLGFLTSVGASGSGLVKKLNPFASAEPEAKAAPVFEPKTPIPADVPLPPRRAGLNPTGSPQAAAPSPMRFASLRAPAADKGKPLDLTARAAQ